jgi:proteasome lid subunit RPN8/RPN11
MPEGVGIPASLWRQVLDHVWAEAPREAVGLLGGATLCQVEQICPLPNLAGPLRFFADPYAQYLAEQRIRAAKGVPLGYYHSHPGGGIELSEDDRHFARRRDWTYIVVATPWPGVLEACLTEWRAAAYRWIGPILAPVPLVVGDDSRARSE